MCCYLPAVLFGTLARFLISSNFTQLWRGTGPERSGMVVYITHASKAGYSMGAVQAAERTEYTFHAFAKAQHSDDVAT